MEKSNLTYKQRMSMNELSGYIKAVGLPILIFALGLFTIKEYGAFGTKLTSPMLSVMWIIAAITSLLLPAQRHNILKETFVTIGCYCVTLLVLHYFLAMVSGVSAQMLMASFDTAVGTAQGNTMTGYIQIAMWISSVMVPVGYAGVQVKRLFSFKKLVAPDRKLRELRSIRKTNVEHIDK